MIDKVKYSSDAEQEKARLPKHIQEELQKVLDDLANRIGDGESGSDRFDGIATDGSRFYVDFGFKHDEDEDILFVDPIYFASY